MKKTFMWALLFAFVCGNALALSPEDEKEQRYQEIKEIKARQRAERLARKEGKTIDGGAAPKEPGFWDKEAERSGVKNWNMSFLKNLNPVPFFKEQQDRYNARKAGVEGGNATPSA